MPWECTWITAREEACPEGDGGVQDIQIRGAHSFDDLLASEEVVWTFFLRQRVCTGLLEVTIKSIWSREIGSRHWTGEQGAVGATARERFPRVYSCKGCRHAETRGEYWMAGLALTWANRCKSGVLHISLLLNIYYKLRNNVCRWSRYHDNDSAYRWWRTYVAIDGDFVDVISRGKVDTLPPHRSIDFAIDLQPGYNLPYGRIYNCSEFGGAIFMQLLELRSRTHEARSWVWT